jgi:hypothetical protein
VTLRWTGMFWKSWSLRFCPTAVLAVSTAAAPAEISTTSLMLPASSVSLSEDVLPTKTSTLGTEMKLPRAHHDPQRFRRKPFP